MIHMVYEPHLEIVFLCVQINGMNKFHSFRPRGQGQVMELMCNSEFRMQFRTPKHLFTTSLVLGVICMFTWTIDFLCKKEQKNTYFFLQTQSKSKKYPVFDIFSRLKILNPHWVIYLYFWEFDVFLCLRLRNPWFPKRYISLIGDLIFPIVYNISNQRYTRLVVSHIPDEKKTT